MMDDAKASPLEPTNGAGPKPDAKAAKVAKSERRRPRTNPQSRRGATDPVPDISPATDPPPDTSPATDPVPDISPATDPVPDSGAPTRDEMSIAFTPAQMAVGGAIVAGLLVVGVRLLLGRRRGRD